MDFCPPRRGQGRPGRLNIRTGSVDNSVQNSAAEAITPPNLTPYGTLHHFRALVESIEMFGEHLRVKKVLCDGGEEFKSSVLGFSPCGNQGCPDVGAVPGLEVRIEQPFWPVSHQVSRIRNMTSLTRYRRRMFRARTSKVRPTVL